MPGAAVPGVPGGAVPAVPAGGGHPAVPADTDRPSLRAVPGPGRRPVPGTPRQEGHGPARAGEGSTLCSQRGLFLGRDTTPGNERFYGSAASRGLCWALSTAPLSLSRVVYCLGLSKGFSCALGGKAV